MPDSARANQSTPVSADQSPSERLGPGTVRRYASDRLVWAVGVAAVLGDLLTTVYGLGIGLREQNPFVVAVLADYGVAGLVGLKLLAVSWVAVVWFGLGRRYGVAAMAGLTLPQTVAVAINVVTILAA